MQYFLALQNSYQALELALFDAQKLIATATIDKLTASRLLIPSIDQLLTRHKITLKDLSFIVVNQGPGPFTTLRVVITTVNGISFASGIPLVGVDGLAALVQEHSQPTTPITIALLNAFNFDVYFAIRQPQQPLITGYKNIYVLLDELKQQFPTQEIHFIGNGVTLYRKDITARFEQQAQIATSLPEFCSLQQLATLGLEQLNNQKNISYQLQPLYLKQFSAVMKPFCCKV